MTLRFILGRAGTGKTGFAIGEIKKEIGRSPKGATVILLVPEQATFQTECQLASAFSPGGTMRAQVLSFRRFAHRVLLETGGAARVPIGELGKRMVLREQLARHRNSLKVFGRSADRPGFTDCLARGLGEMKNYLITPSGLEEAAVSLAGKSVLLHDKLSDIALLYRWLDERLSEHYADPDDVLRCLAENLAHSMTFRSSIFWLDGFKGFTPQELLVIKQLLPVAAEVNIVLTLEPAHRDQILLEDDLFYPTWETYRVITEIAADTDIPVTDPVLFDQQIPLRFKKSKALAHLEKHFFAYPAPVFLSDDQTSNEPAGETIPGIRIVAAANRRAEVEACAREIITLARDYGYRWREITIALRDLQPYHELLGAIFSDYQIPFFIDHKQPVMHHPLVEFIRSALEIVSRDWTYESVFRCLKTDLIPLTRDEVFRLENYVLAHGIRGSKWRAVEDWSYRRRYTLGEDAEPDERETAILEQINETRRKAISDLAVFCDAMEQAGCVRKMAVALYGLLDNLRVYETLDSWKMSAETAGNLVKAREHAQIWQSIMGLLDEVVVALGDEEMSVETFLSILDAGFESLTIGLVPPGLDQVIIGTLDRSRNTENRALFLLGASEGVIPARPSDDGIFNDYERELLQGIGIKLAPGSRRQVFEEQFLVYTAFTRAGERLWISYPKADEEGRAIAPSPAITRLKELFPGFSEQYINVEPETIDFNECLGFVANRNRSLSYLSAKMREAKSGLHISSLWPDLYNWFVKNADSPKNRAVLKSVFHINREHPVPGSICRNIYGSPVKASVSRIEKFRACPFAHFASYGLSLQERRVFRLEAPDMGELFHAALKRFAEELERQSLDWGQLTPQDCSKLNEGIISELAPQLQSEILLSTARYRYLLSKLKRTVDRATVVLSRHSRQSRFHPVGLELSFGPGGQLPPLTLSLPGGEFLELRGRIDRLDMAGEDTSYLRIIDYKSSDQQLRLEDVFYGLKLQLLTYLHVALNYYRNSLGLDARPGGILYFTVKEPMISGVGPIGAQEAEKAVLNRLKMRGFLLADQKVFKMMDDLVESGYSDLFPVGLKKDGTFYSGSQVLDEQQFSLLCSHLEKILSDSGQEILQGQVDIYPFRNNFATACQYCDFKPVCQFDSLLEDNIYRTMAPVSQEEIWPSLSGRGKPNE